MRPRRSRLRHAVGLPLAGVAVVALVPASAEAFSATATGPGVSISTGPSSDSVSLYRGPDGRIAVEVPGQQLDGAAAGGCMWDPDIDQLLCPSDTRLEVHLGDGDDSLDISGDAVATALGEGGNDQLQAGTGSGSTLDGGDGNDVLAGDGGVDVLIGGAGEDQLDGGAGDDRLRGDDGNDVLTPGAGANTADGGGGNDQILVEGSGDNANGGDGDDQLIATDATGPATLDGGAGNDALTGSPFADRLSGGAGDDMLLGDLGGDALVGGEGTDVASYSDHDGPVRVTVGGGVDDGQPGEDDDVQDDVEQVDGTSDNDTLVAGPSGTILNGLDGDDLLVGSAGPSRLRGGAGRDRLGGGSAAGATSFEGGPDIDEVTYRQRLEPLTIDLSSDAPVSGAAGEGDRFLDAVENVVGGGANDRIVGRPGTPHRIAAGAGDDAIVVREGADQEPDAGADSVRCEAGRDVVEGDRFDTVGEDCERVLVDGFLRRPEIAFGTKSSDRVTVSRSGRIARVRVGCDWKTRGYCGTTVLLRDPGRKRTNFARREVRILAGRTLTVRVPAVSGKRAAQLAKRKSVLVVVAARDKLGNGSISKRTIKTRRG